MAVEKTAEEMEAHYQELIKAPIRIKNYESDMHVLPEKDIFPHIPDANCACLPVLDSDNEEAIKRGRSGQHIFVHRQILSSEDLN
jgi:hypothetical protein